MITHQFFKGTDNLKDALSIRRKVFIEEQGIPESIEMDAFNKCSEHVVVYEGNKPVATGRLVNKHGEFSIGRVAVLPEYRGGRIGARVVSQLIELAKGKGAAEIHIHAQTNVQGFYVKLGFRSCGEVFEEAGIPHIHMVLSRD